MTQLKLYDTLTREKRAFTSIDPANIGMYVCGVTPYDDSHIGHARAYVVFDVLYRLLKHLYPQVTYVRNFTDIDDKIIERAQENGEDPTALSERFIQEFYKDMDALNIQRPTHEPRVSTSMPGIVQMVDELLAQNKAYVTTSGDVMFDVPAFEKTGGHQPFGTLARRTFDKLQARVEGDEEKRDPRDFPIWKANAKSATKLEQAFHPDQLGAKLFNAPGRPGWHIECSVMSKQHLGPTFDIHGGGEDLQFPHHSCEIAQSEALLPAGQPMANYWLHNGFITVNGTKMSKSLGNFTTIKDALQKYSPEAIRLWLLQTHYRKPVDYSDEALQSSENAIKRFKNAFEKLEQVKSETPNKRLVHDRTEDVVRTLSNDLSTSDALTYLFAMLDVIEKGTAEFISTKDILNLDTALEAAEYIKPNLSLLGLENVLLVKAISNVELKLIEARATARTAKNFPESDRLREELKSLGILVEDGPQGQTWRRI